MWECGLKYRNIIIVVLCIAVTPRVGVWIEIAVKVSHTVMAASLPVWECGLK